MSDDAKLFAQIPALAAGGAAVITGGASGIGLAAARAFAQAGLGLVLADLDSDLLEQARARLLAEGAKQVIALRTDVSRLEEVERLRAETYAAFPSVAVLMNNAGIGLNPGSAFKNIEAWRTLLGTNFAGVLHGVQCFLPWMLEQKRPALVINTGSKQGITTPPGNTAYNAAKAAVKVLTEGLAHELRGIEGCQITAHLLVPGFTWTGINARQTGAEKPPGAWMPDQVVSFMLEGLSRGDFYILCPDNEVSRAIDERRIQWAADDLIKNRPALSRWHRDYAGAFAAFMKAGG